MSHCVKTGAQVFIQELGAVYAADIYAVGGNALVIRFNEKSKREVPTLVQNTADFGDVLMPVPGSDFTHIAYQAGYPSGDWLREDLGVMALPAHHLSGELHWSAVV